MSEEAERLKARTMKFALDVCGLIKKLPVSEPGSTARRQLAKCATGVAFNYGPPAGHDRMPSSPQRLEL